MTQLPIVEGHSIRYAIWFAMKIEIETTQKRKSAFFTKCRKYQKKTEKHSKINDPMTSNNKSQWLCFSIVTDYIIVLSIECTMYSNSIFS